MECRERIHSALRHKTTDRIPIDFGGSPVTGIHVLAIKKLRDYFQLEKRPVKVIEPYQMLGELDDELKEIIGIVFKPVYKKCKKIGIPINFELFRFWISRCR